MAKAKKLVQTSTETPIFDLKAFSDKATWAHFYIEQVSQHIEAHRFVSKPHSHDFYLILFIEQGKGSHRIDFVEYPVSAGSVFLMSPGQVHSWDLSDDVEGVVIFFTRDFYQMQLSQNSLLEFPFYHSLTASPHVQTTQVDVLKFITKQMYCEYSHAKPDVRMLRAYLDIFLLESAKHYKLSDAFALSPNAFRIRRLEQLIDENFRTLKQPADYAALMNVAPGYLNSICKQSVNRTLSALIQERILLEAKRILTYSALNVNEVSRDLGFADASYFVRWFRQHAGLPPDDFRKSVSNV